MQVDESWDIFYEQRQLVATGATHRLELGKVKGNEWEFIKFASARQSNAAARTIDFGVVIQNEFYRFHRTTTGAAFQVVGQAFEMYLTDGMIWAVEFGSMAANDEMELWVHGQRKKRVE